jgi:hypothetical protein
MGIDIYARWKGQTKEEERAQYTGFDVTAGKFGYLREAYHGEPYATKTFLKEAFEADHNTATIPAKKLVKRLPLAISEALKRQLDLYEADLDDIDDTIMSLEIIKSFVDFALLCAKKEKETEKPCEIFASY